MLQPTHIFCVTAFLVIFHSPSVDSVKCYKCEGPLNLGLSCENNLKEIPVIECATLVCSHYVVGNPGSQILSRGCRPTNICQSLEDQYATNPAVSVTRCTTCDSDLCNSANTVTATVIVAIAMLLQILSGWV
ncbi:hypothetical protein MTP99_017433 [Tenebrio molitor]|jgi:hypothetical protein|uniref:Protein sleepless n=1 Tax=Tenebrio molitor TaxID=7067 RepID=A0A8J6LG86_TENMO|nr:hypothetical protein GEV33_002181 [Tenebrio molitor]KAJ3623770.1 hypothetical protein MTP99_017433 [Tenebrio molitor]CAH1376058.1 unnamed protein product [Tenebrio molitor]